MGTGVWPARKGSSAAPPSSCLPVFPIFKMALVRALSHGTVVNRVLKVERRSELVLHATVCDCDLPVLSREAPPFGDPGQGLSGWILAAPDQTLWRPQEPSFSW